MNKYFLVTFVTFVTACAYDPELYIKEHPELQAYQKAMVRERGAPKMGWGLLADYCTDAMDEVPWLSWDARFKIWHQLSLPEGAPKDMVLACRPLSCARPTVVHYGGTGKYEVCTYQNIRYTFADDRLSSITIY